MVSPSQMHPQCSHQVRAKLLSRRYRISLEPVTYLQSPWSAGQECLASAWGSAIPILLVKKPRILEALHPSIASTSTNLNLVTDRNKSKWCPPTTTRIGARKTREVPYFSKHQFLSCKSTRAQVLLSRPRQMAPVPANRGPPSDAGGGSTPTMAGCGCRGCRIRSPLGDRFCVILPETRKPDWSPTVHPPAQGRRLTQEAAGRTGSLPRRPGLGVPRHPPPQAIMGRGAGAGERSVERERSPATAMGICQRRPKRGELVGGTEGARRRRRPPAHPAPCALRHRAGTRTPGRSRLEGLALHSAVQGP